VGAWLAPSGSAIGPGGDETLSLLRDFVADNVQVLRLLQALTEGHEAFRHREYGLALAAYDRADQWFGAVSSDPVWQRWWRNVEVGDTFEPAFEAVDDPLFAKCRQYYVRRRTAFDRQTLLETLHVDVADYHRWPLLVLDAGAPELPFCKFLYYIANFMLPLSKADCYARLGNYCAALDQCFRAYYEPAFTGPLDAGREQTLAQAVGGGATSYGTLSEFAMSANRPDQYFPDYLNDIEKKAVRLRVAGVLLSWGDTHYRRRENADAQACYAQVLRLFHQEWNAVRDLPLVDETSYASAAANLGVNPRAGELAFSAHRELAKLTSGLNYLGYPDDYVPIWTYPFLLNSARYFADRAKQSGRDALQFLAAAEQEQGNRRLLMQSIAISEAQLAVESRRVDEAAAMVELANTGVAAAEQRRVNNESRREELENWAPIQQTLGITGAAMSGAGFGGSLGNSIGALAGGMGGPVGAVSGMPAGMAYGGISAYFSGQVELELQRNELVRQRLELEKAEAMARAEVARAEVSLSVARLARQVAALNLAFAHSNLVYAQAKTLNAEFWYQTSLRLADLASAQLERAVGVAFLCEQAFEFMEGRRVDVIRFDYGQSEGVLAADALIADLDSIEYERVTGRLAKATPVKKILRLRERDFRAFAELKRTGSVTFDVPLAEFDFSDPGSYQQRIAAVEVDVRALVPPEGLRGTLRKSGLSHLRYRTGAGGTGVAPANTATDWIVETPTDFRVAPIIQPSETLLLSPFDVRRDGVVLRPDPGEQLRVFEGSGVATTWTLSLRPCANAFDFSTISDVDLHIYYYAQFDERLEKAVNLERRKLIALGRLTPQQARGFSLRESYPDEMYHLHNPVPDPAAEPWQQRTLTLEWSPAIFPPNQINRRLQGITVAAVSARDFLDVKGSLTKGAFSLAPAAFQPAPDDTRVYVAAGANEPPEGTWTFTIAARDNPSLAMPGLYKIDASNRVVLGPDGRPVADAIGVPVFDPAKIAAIADIWIILNYRYDQAGVCGEPIALWADFARGDQGRIVQNGAVSATAWQPRVIAGAAAWSRADGFMTQTASGQSVLIPAVSVDRADVAMAARLRLPAQPGVSAGFVARGRDDGSGSIGDRYVARVTRVANDKTEVALERVASGSHQLLRAVTVSWLSAATELDLALRCRGHELEVLVNGQSCLKASDAALASGRIGLYSGGAGAGFADVLVSDLTGR
jgi:hypothetical protein